MTLIEVVAGIALLGTLMVAVLISGSQHLRQLKAADQKRQATAKLDDFLAAWALQNFSDDGLSVAAARAGLSVADHPVASDSTQTSYVVEVSPRPALIDGGKVLRLDVSAQRPNGTRRPAAWAEILVEQ